MIELDPKYVDVTIERFQQLTGEEAVHAETGMTFARLKDWREIEGDMECVAAFVDQEEKEAANVG